MRKWWPAVVGVVALLVVGSVVLVGCLDRTGGEPTPTSTTSAASTPTATEGSMTADELAALVFEGDVGTSQVLASVDGTVLRPGGEAAARVDVTSVTADEFSTVVRFTLVNTSGDSAVIPLTAFNSQSLLARDIRDVALVDPTVEQRYRPYIGETQDGTQFLCACSTAPVAFGDAGQLLSATFPPLDPATESVRLEVPGFEPVDVPVARR